MNNPNSDIPLTREDGPWTNHLLVAYSLSGNSKKVFSALQRELWVRGSLARYGGVCLTNTPKEGVRGHLKDKDRSVIETIQQNASLDTHKYRFRGERFYSSVTWIVPSYGRFVTDEATGRRVKDDMIPQPLKELLQAEKCLPRDTPQFIIGTGNLTFGRDFCAAVRDVEKILKAQGYTDITHAGDVDICASKEQIEDMATTICEHTDQFLSMLESNQAK